MNYYGSNNDWLDYLQHGQQGKERKGHKYYARIAVGRNKLGFTQYRYFYDAREYGAYMANKQKDKSALDTVPHKAKDNKTTYYVTGFGKNMTDQKKVQSDLARSRANGVDTIRGINNDGSRYISTDSMSWTAHTKTVHDNKTLRKAKRSMKAVAQKGKAKVASLLKKAAERLES